MSKPEPLLERKDNRFTLFPIDHQDIWEIYESAIASFWTPHEIDLSQDLKDWETMGENEKHFIKNVLAFFASADGIVNENLVKNFYDQIENATIRQVYVSQMFIEGIHSHMYSLLIETYIRDEDEKHALFNSVETNPSIRKKAAWALRWIDNGSFTQRLIAFAVVEGVFFSGAFCAIFWIKIYYEGKLNGLVNSNEFISRDEKLHCDTAVTIYRKLVNKLSEAEVHQIFREAIALECEFITEALPVSLIGMNAALMQQYIRFVGDFWLRELGYAPLYDASNPFPFMEWISLETKANFFEIRPTNYAMAKKTVIEFDGDDF